MSVKNIDKLDYHYQGDVEEIVFFKMPKILFLGDDFKELSMSAKMVYMLLLDRVSISKKNNWVDKNNQVFIYYTQVEVMKKLKFGNKKVSNLFKDLEKFNLIKRIKQGFNKPDLIYVKSIASLEVEDTSYDGEFKYGRPDIEHSIDEQNEIQLLEETIAVATEKEKSNNSTEKTSNVENVKLVDMTCQNDITGDVKMTLSDVSLQQPNNNNINNNNINNNNSFILSEINKINGMKEGMINKSIKKLPFSLTKSENKMNVAIKELFNYTTTLSNFKNNKIADFYFSTYKLFINSLSIMLTNKKVMTLNNQTVTYSKVYNKLSEYINPDNSTNFNNLVEVAIKDYQKGSSNSNIKYPQKYMQACIWNVLQIGDISLHSNLNFKSNSNSNSYNSSTNKIHDFDNTQTSYNLQEVEDLWNSGVQKFV